jgi:3',5'-cyclic AMP phosphodiesterase CpdA
MIHTNFNHFSKIAINAISGNHEATYRCGSNETYKHFNNKIPPQNSTERGYYYSFEYGGVKFIMLNTNESLGSALSPEQYEWLVAELANNECHWTVVAMHEPMYSLGKYGINPAVNQTSVALREQLTAAFAKYGVDIVLQGHDHIITRTYPIDESGNPTDESLICEGGINYSVNPNGVIYLMNGCSGGQPRNLCKPETYASVRDKYYRYAINSKECSWAEISVGAERLLVSVKYVDDSGVHKYCEWGIKKHKKT